MQAANAAFNRVAAMENVQKRLADLTMTVRSDTTPQVAAKWMQDEMAKWDEVIRGAGIKID